MRRKSGVRPIGYVLGAGLLLAVVLLAARPNAPAARAQAQLQKGFSYAAWWPGFYSTPDADLSLARLAGTGSNWVSIIVTQYQNNLNSTSIGPTEGTPTDADVIHAIDEAHQLGLKVMLKPHVDLWDDPDHWRGEIGGFNAAQWNNWFASYRTFINHYATLAEDNDVEQFAVGVELSGTEDQETHWRTTIEGVRGRFSGPITYAANHSGDETSLTWWDAVDYIGVDAYYPLSSKNNPSPAELSAAWQPIVATLAALSEQWDGKPILFTEIGYRSIDGANKHPWDWQIGGTVDLQEQAQLYQAALAAVSDQPWFAGFYWWNWDVDPYQGGPCGIGYEIYDKPAENVLRGWYGAPPRPIDTPPAADYSTKHDIYLDALQSGWESWSWDATVNFKATNQAYSGARSASVKINQAWGALYLHHNGIDTSPYTFLEFYVRKGTAAQQLNIIAFDGGDDEIGQRPLADCRYTDGASIAGQTWTRVRVPLEHLNADGRALGGVAIQADRTGTFWIDDMRLVAAQNGVYAPIILTPVEDSYARQAKPKANFGNQKALRVQDAAKDMVTYLKFDVTGVTGPVQSATLRLYVTDPGPDGGSVYSVDNTYQSSAAPWVEGGLNWNNAPPIGGAPLDSAGAAARKQWVEWDVTAAVAGDGIYSFGLRNAHRNAVHYSSSEGKNSPQLVIEVGE